MACPSPFYSSSFPLLMSPEGLAAWIGEPGAEGRRPGSSPLCSGPSDSLQICPGLLDINVLLLSFVIVYCPRPQLRFCPVRRTDLSATLRMPGIQSQLDLVSAYLGHFDTSDLGCVHGGNVIVAHLALSFDTKCVSHGCSADGSGASTSVSEYLDSAQFPRLVVRCPRHFMVFETHY
ncbi:hypothetical protein PENSOL_c080G08360 [Penicillium solitum]|uniref:Uncharacterized protein n=1 Tax=Penicillium solitum TaxID=60172 RepID=A0A1V6QDQ2_9EURO|nr:uncharacterized protein PENSOL_c080G08360 [Penicillium solitum]OQD87333.1 hypothetical protein PENSOL_c080G08360 [Penicillium solitum]